MRVLLIVVGVLAFLASPVAADDATTDDGAKENIAAGKAMAMKLCARCHAIGLTGDSPFAPAPPFRTFGKKWPIDSLAEAFAEGIVVGHPAMPEFQFEPDQVDALLAYLESLVEE